MTGKNRKAPGAVGRAGAPEGVFRAVDITEHTVTVRAVQAARLLQRIKVSQAVALTLAELVFSNGRATR